MCALPVAKRNFSKRHSHGILYLAKRWGEQHADRSLSCQVISDCANEDTPTTSSDEPVRGNSENDENNKLLVVAETVDANPYDRNQNEERKLEGVESRDPLFELVTRNLVPWVPPDEESCVTPVWESKTPSPGRDLNNHLSTWPERTFRCANPPQSMALARETLVSRPLYPRVAPLAEPGVGISPEHFASFVDGIDFSKVFDLDGLDFDDYESYI